MHRMILSLTIFIILITACTPQQTPTPTKAPELSPTLAPTVIIEIPPTAIPTATPEPFAPIRLITQENMDEEILDILQSIPQQILAWVSRPPEDFTYDLFVFSKDDGSNYQDSLAVMSVDNTAFVILRTQKFPESTDQIVGDTTIRPLLIKTDEAGNVAYLTQDKNEAGEITESILMESATRDDGQEIFRAYLLDGTTLESETASLASSNEFFGKLAMAVPITKNVGLVILNPETGHIEGTDSNGKLIELIDGIWSNKPESTDFTGMFSEKYSPSFSESFLYKDEQSGIEFPINIGLSPEFPVKSFKLTDLGKEYLGKRWLKSAYFRYSQTMGNKDVTYEQYLNLVTNGQGKLDYLFIDEITNEIKSTKIDPRNGVSVLITSREDLPMDALPANYAFQATSYLTMNNQGQPIISVAYTFETLEYNYNAVIIERKYSSVEYFFAQEIFLIAGGQFNYFALLTKDNFYRGGQMTNRPSGVLNEDEPAIIELFRSIDKKTEPYPFAEDVKYYYVQP